MNAGSFAQAVLRAVIAADERASFLTARPHGKTAVIGFLDDGEWVPVFRITGGSGAYNVASLQVRHRTTWQPTLVRGVPAAVAEQLIGPLRFLWEQHAHYSQPW